VVCAVFWWEFRILVLWFTMGSGFMMFCGFRKLVDFCIFEVFWGCGILAVLD